MNRALRIGVIAAMDKEVSLIKDSLCNIKESIGFTNGYVGEKYGAEVILYKSGIGKVNAALAASNLIEKYSPDAIISTGVAGGLSSNVKPLDIIVADKCAYHDVDCGSDVEKGCVQGTPKFYLSQGELLDTALSVIKDAKLGTIVSGDTFVNDEEQKQSIRRDYPMSLAVDMESCAIAQVCHKYGCPFLAVRVISDMCDKEEYQQSWNAIGEKSFRVLSSIIADVAKRHPVIVGCENKIASFEVNHLKLKRGVYVSRKDRFGSEIITTFDVRMKEPYKDKPLEQGAVHTIEHIGATYLRNNKSIKDKVVYWGPMGCLTGFYLIMHGNLSPMKVVPYLRGLFAHIVESETIPGNTQIECGNCGLHDLAKAKEEAASYWGLLMNLKEENIHYLQ